MRLSSFLQDKRGFKFLLYKYAANESTLIIISVHFCSLSKRFGLSPSSHSVEYSLSTLESLQKMEGRVKAAGMTGAKLKNKAHLQALPLRVFPAEHNCAKESVMDRVTSSVKMFRDRETRQILLYALKVLAKIKRCLVGGSRTGSLMLRK